MEGIILLIIAGGAILAFLLGTVLLFLYFRSGRSHTQPRDAVVYGRLAQCPNCGYMNPIDTAACLNCRSPLRLPRGYQPPPPQVMANMPTYDMPHPAPPPPPQPAEDTAMASPTPGPLFPQPAPEGTASMMPRAWLEGVSGAMMGQRIDITHTDTLVGRSTSCDVQVFDPKASRKHFLIRFGNGAFYLQDQQSSRGTMINGKRVMAQRLTSGDRIELGDSSFIFHTN